MNCIEAEFYDTDAISGMSVLFHKQNQLYSLALLIFLLFSLIQAASIHFLFVLILNSHFFSVFCLHIPSVIFPLTLFHTFSYHIIWLSYFYTSFLSSTYPLPRSGIFLFNLMLQFMPIHKVICIHTQDINKSPLIVIFFLSILFRACVGARDPYCGWDLLLKKCTTLEESVRMSQWEQSITKCPVSMELMSYLCMK